MKRFFRKIVAVLMAVAIIPIGSTAVFAESAQKGDTVTVSVCISNEPNMALMTATVAFDTVNLELVTYDTPIGSSVCNDTIDGELTWATIYDPADGLDFTEETEIFSAEFNVNGSVGDIESLLSLEVKETSDAFLNEIPLSDVNMYCSVFHDSEQKPNEFVISKYEGTGVNPQGSAEDSDNTDSNPDEQVSTVTSRESVSSAAVSSKTERSSVSSASNSSFVTATQSTVSEKISDTDTNSESVSKPESVAKSNSATAVEDSDSEEELEEYRSIVSTASEDTNSDNGNYLYILGIIIACGGLAVLVVAFILLKKKKH